LSLVEPSVFRIIANEPDDQMSFVRLLVSSNQFDIEALVATTSRHLRTGPRPDVLRSGAGLDRDSSRVIDAAEEHREPMFLDELVDRAPTALPVAVVVNDQHASRRQPRKEMYEFVSRR
jgi:hypothetical protein